MGDNLDLRFLHLSAKKGNAGDLDKLMRYFESYVKKYSHVNGKFDDDAYQEMNIKLWKCLNKFEYKIAS
ncbi:MAG: helix-turn-helix domain-containing protein [Anaeromicrobium sp.]|jgi:DNA-directed RNA polymerase specialized sigma24 family protein|uniref:helix-turn-helix domain-containing protein n=1 Tax=Anaeromicrobium sp. TaxID=1929132 RepID=UPI0025DCE36A|nr:helix-turn-helix domain-containing protein [Anaeromicrobium sp.]MCT4595222.1 helix-turn-helix domain-containing protein [Anaeromicrobium sp.]